MWTGENAEVAESLLNSNFKFEQRKKLICCLETEEKEKKKETSFEGAEVKGQVKCENCEDVKPEALTEM